MNNIKPNVMEELEEQIARNKGHQHSARLATALHDHVMSSGIITKSEDRMKVLMKQCSDKIGDAICDVIESGRTWITVDQVSKRTNIKISVAKELMSTNNILKVTTNPNVFDIVLKTEKELNND